MKAEDIVKNAETLAKQVLDACHFDEETKKFLFPHTIQLFTSAREPKEKRHARIKNNNAERDRLLAERDELLAEHEKENQDRHARPVAAQR